jgi:hypothetical protein
MVMVVDGRCLMTFAIFYLFFPPFSPQFYRRPSPRKFWRESNSYPLSILLYLSHTLSEITCIHRQKMIISLPDRSLHFIFFRIRFSTPISSMNSIMYWATYSTNITQRLHSHHRMPSLASFHLSSSAHHIHHLREITTTTPITSASPSPADAHATLIATSSHGGGRKCRLHRG